MYKALVFFNELSKEDLDWVFDVSFEQQCIANTVILKEKEIPDAIYFVLKGLVNVTNHALDQVVATIGPGDIFGEMSFLENEPASATITASETTLLLALPKKDLKQKIQSDLSFAAKFYRALALVAIRRLRRNMGLVDKIYHTQHEREEGKGSIMDELSQEMHVLKEMLQSADKEALKNDEEVPEEFNHQIQLKFQELILQLHHLIGDEAPGSPMMKAELGTIIQQEMLPYILLTHVGERYYSKPRGYAGDFLTIEYIYENRPRGSGRLGPVLDACYLDLPAARAVRNRRGLLAEEIQKILDAKADGQTTHITSLASGPAAEVFDVYENLSDPNLLKTTCIDIDLQALAFVADKRDKRRLKRHIKLENGNLVYLAMGREKLLLKPQDLVYSIGLIDYFSDEFVINLLNYVHSLLVPGGKVILGNFHPRNTSKALMDYVIDWKLIHRTEDDMNRLFKTSAFNAPCVEIRFEEEGINLFAIGVKEG